MHKIDHATATLTNTFTEGDPQGGIKPTVVTADFLNAVQNEIVNFITAMGITLNKADNTQLTQALGLLKTISNTNFTIANNQANTLMGTSFEFDLSVVKSVTLNCDIYRKDATQEKTASGFIKIISKPIAGTVELIQKFDGDEDFGIVFGIDVVTDGSTKVAKLKYTSTDFIGANYLGKMVYSNTIFKL